MVNCCAAVNCNNIYDKENGITLHRFPIKDPELLKRWIQAVRRDKWNPTKWSVLCSQHFRKEDFYPDQNCKRLREDAIPTIFSHRPLVKKRPPPKERKPLEPKQSVSKNRNVLEEVESNIICNLVPNENKENGNVERKTAVETPETELHIIDPVITKGRKRRSQEELLQEIKRLREQLRRRDIKITTLEELRDCLYQYNVDFNAWDFIENNFSAEIVMLLKNVCRNGSVPPSGHRFTENILAFANTLHYYSPKAYQFISSIFTLPSLTTLWRVLDSVNCEPGFLSEVFSRIKNDLPIKPWLKDSVLILDAMSIRKGIRYNVKSQKMIGYVDYGTSVNVEAAHTLASEVLVVMLVSVTHFFKVPIAYFLTDKTSGYVLSQIVISSIEKLKSIGVSVWAVTFDGAPSNMTCAKELGCKIDQKNQVFVSTFKNPVDDYQISIFLDPCHMMKLARNTLSSYKMIETDDGIIEWRYLVYLDELQREIGLRFGNKLAGQHINFQNAKMKVRFAVQLISSSVADALEFLEKAGHPKFVGVSETVKFLRMLDRLFDILNSKNFAHSGYKQPLKWANSKYWCSVLEESKQYLLKLQYAKRPLVESAKSTFVVGLIFCIQSTQEFAKNLLQRPKDPLQFVRMYTICQDHLELFFGTLRRRGGENDNPDAMQLNSNIKRVLVKNNVTASAFGNIAVDTSYSITILDFSSKKKNHGNVENDQGTVHDLQEERDVDEPEEELLYHQLKNLNMYEENILFYIAGYIVRKLLPRVKCPQCKAALIEKKTQQYKDHTYAGLGLLTPQDFLRFVNKGGLILPSKTVFEIVKLSEKCFRSLISSMKFHGKNLTDIIVNEVLHRNSDQKNFFAENGEHISKWAIGESLHSTQLIKLVSYRFTTMRLKVYSKNLTREIVAKNQCTIRAKYTKTILFKGC